MDGLIIFFWGFIGGCAPEIVRVWKIMQEDHTFRYSKSMFIVSMLMAMLGGFFAYALNVITPYQAIYAGVTTPVLISKMMESPIQERWQQKNENQ